MDELNALRTFWADLSREVWACGGDIEYLDFLETGEACGLLIREPYSVEKHGDVVQGDPEVGDLIYVTSGLAKAPERSMG